MQHVKTYQRLAQSSSSLGAALFGLGVGAIWGAVINNWILIATLIIGAVIHIAGMYVIQFKNHKNAGLFSILLWISAWLCLLSIIGIFIYISFK